MGGSLCIGIKRNNVETIVEGWTNYFFGSVIHDPCFQYGGKAVDDYLAAFKDDKIKIIIPSEYGVVLIDFDNKQLLSCQGYSNPETMYFTNFSTNSKEQARIVKDIIDKDLFEKASDMANIQISLNEVKLMADNIISRNKIPATAIAVTHKSPLNIVHSIDCGIDEWKEVRFFLKKNDWKSKAWSLARFKKENPEDE